MTGADTQEFHPHVPFLYEMVISFFVAARETLDPVLQAIDGYQELETDHDGRPAPPDHVARKFTEVPGSVAVGYVGACLTATTNLGLAYMHSFRLLSFLIENKDALPANAAKPHLAKLFDALPTATRDALCDVYDQVGAHDFELEMGAGPRPDRGVGAGRREETKDEPRAGERKFRSTLAYWQSNAMPAG